MRFDLSEEQQAFSSAADTALRRAADDRDGQDAALRDLGVASDALLDARSPLLMLALAAEMAGRHLSPLRHLHAGLARLLLRQAADEAPPSEIGAGDTGCMFALGATHHRLVEGDGRDWILWQEGALLSLFAPGAVVLEPAARADHSRGLHIVSLSGARPLLTVPLAAKARDAMLVLQAADSFGAASHAFEMTLDYARTRIQFGRPIGSFQAYQHQMADLAVDLDPCRYLWWRAAYAWNDGNEADQLALLAKAHVCDVAVQVTRAAIEAHGAIGFTEAYPLHHYAKRVRENWSAVATPAAAREVYARARW